MTMSTKGPESQSYSGEAPLEDDSTLFAQDLGDPFGEDSAEPSSDLTSKFAVLLKSVGSETSPDNAAGLSEQYNDPNLGQDNETRACGSQANSDALGLAGAKLGNLKIERKLGGGGMGDVWAGRDTDLDVPVAVKVLPPHLAADPNVVMRFIREARAVAQLDHQNIVRVLQAGKREYQGQFLRIMVMELVEGCDAHDLMRDSSGGKLDPRTAAGVALGVAKALRYAHSKHIIHRDIKPANVLVRGDPGDRRSDAIVKVLDFGLAKVLEGGLDDGRPRPPQAESPLSITGHIVGTPQYMAPERAQFLPVDGRADIYSLGITLYELLTGKRPFEGGTAYSIIKKHVEEPLEFPREAFCLVPPMFQELIEGMCQKAPDDRWPLEQVISKLEEFLGISGRSVVVAPTPEPEKPRHNILTPANSFVGRAAEFSEVESLLQSGTRLVTVIGPAGVGKTRFSQEFGLRVANGTMSLSNSSAQETQSNIEGDIGLPSVHFCDVSAARNVDDICNSVARGLGIPLTTADSIGQIHTVIRMRGKMVIILDNFEQVAKHSAETLGQWLKNTPQVQFLVTSREPLHLQGEQGYWLNPLDEPTHGVELYINRAKEANSRFSADAESTDAIMQIVQALDGIPLAIELAAARTLALSPQKILQLLRKRFDLLTSRRRDANTRQLTLRGAIEWSWNLLDPWEQLALAQCSIFADGFLLEAAEDVIDLSEHKDAPDTMVVIVSLVEKSLLRTLPAPGLPGENRYRMYESIREFALSKLGEIVGKPRRDELHCRHAKHYLSYGERWAELVNGPRAVEALDRLQAELENFFAVQDAMEPRDPIQAAQAVELAAQTMETRGSGLLRVQKLERAISKLGALRQCSDSLLPPHTPLAIRLHAHLTIAHKEIGTLVGMETAASMAEEVARAWYTQENDAASARLLTLGLQAKCLPLLRAGNLVQAAQVIEESVIVARKFEDKLALAISLGDQGNIHFSLGEYKAAVACFDEAEAIQRDLGNRDGVATNVGSRGNVHSRRCEYNEALACYAEAEAIQRGLGNRAIVAICISNRGNILLWRGEYDAALACYAEAEKIARDLGHKGEVAIIIGSRGKVHSSRGEYEAALACYAEAEEIAREQGDRARLALWVGERGHVQSNRGEYNQALTCYVEAEAILRDILDREGVAALVCSRGNVFYSRGEYALALACYAEAEKINRELCNRAGVAINVGNRGSVHVNRGEYDQALICYTEEEAIARELGNKDDVATWVNNRRIVLRALGLLPE